MTRPKRTFSSLVGAPFRLSSGRTLQTTPVFDIYWHFAFERQEVFHRRVVGDGSPWTNDLILRTYKFTNVYRVADKASQFLIRHVIYEGDASPEEVFFRTILFKMFNRIETWTLMRDHIGPLSWRTFDFDRYNAVLDRALQAGETIYSSAYIMPNPPFGARRKHANHLLLLAHMMTNKIFQQVVSAKSLHDVFTLLRSLPSIGDFLAFQYAVDINYSELTNFSEMDFVVAGPGARSGIRKAFVNLAGLSEEELIREVAAVADREFAKRGLPFRTLWGRPLQLIDCQNLFCEVDKYARVAYPQVVGTGRTRIKRKFTPSPAFLPQWYPPKWGLRTT